MSVPHHRTQGTPSLSIFFQWHHFDQILKIKGEKEVCYYQISCPIIIRETHSIFDWKYPL